MAGDYNSGKGEAHLPSTTGAGCFALRPYTRTFLLETLMTKLRLSLGQMDIALGKPDENFEQVRAWTAEAAQHGSSLVVFPELWSTGYDLENWPKHATPLDL